MKNLLLLVTLALFLPSLFAQNGSGSEQVSVSFISGEAFDANKLYPNKVVLENESGYTVLGMPNNGNYLSGASIFSFDAEMNFLNMSIPEIEGVAYNWKDRANTYAKDGIIYFLSYRYDKAQQKRNISRYEWNSETYAFENPELLYTVDYNKKLGKWQENIIWNFSPDSSLLALTIPRELTDDSRKVFEVVVIDQNNKVKWNKTETIKYDRQHSTLFMDLLVSNKGQVLIKTKVRISGMEIYKTEQFKSYLINDAENKLLELNEAKLLLVNETKMVEIPLAPNEFTYGNVKMRFLPNEVPQVLFTVRDRTNLVIKYVTMTIDQDLQTVGQRNEFILENDLLFTSFKENSIKTLEKVVAKGKFISERTFVISNELIEADGSKTIVFEQHGYFSNIQDDIHSRSFNNEKGEYDPLDKEIVRVKSQNNILLTHFDADGNLEWSKMIPRYNTYIIPPLLIHLDNGDYVILFVDKKDVNEKTEVDFATERDKQDTRIFYVFNSEGVYSRGVSDISFRGELNNKGLVFKMNALKKKNVIDGELTKLIFDN